MPAESNTSLTCWGAWGYNLPVPRACWLCFYSVFLGKENSAVSKLEWWLWLSDLLLPVRHVKQEKDGKFNANHRLFEARSSLAVSHCSTLWRNCFSLGCFQMLLWRNWKLGAESPRVGPRTSQSPDSSCSGGDRLSLPWLEFSDPWHQKYPQVRSTGTCFVDI